MESWFLPIVQHNLTNNNHKIITQDHIHSAVLYGVKPYARIHFGSSERRSVSARWLPTCSRSCKLDLKSLHVGCYMPNIHLWPCILLRSILIYCPSEGGRAESTEANEIKLFYSAPLHLKVDQSWPT